MTFIVDGSKVTINDYMKVVNNMVKVEVTPEILAKVQKCRDILDEKIKNKIQSYGVTTGFGALKNVNIDISQLEELQKNLLLSHAVGQGEASPNEVVRGMFFHRLISLCFGNSGVRVYIIHKIIEALNKNFIPYVPILGTVGASGDLAPLSHLFISLMGYGFARELETGDFVASKTALEQLEIEPIEKLEAKEGLALNNGTQFITAWTILAQHKAYKAYLKSNLIAATTLEALHGTHVAFDERIHAVRPHTGQIETAKHMRQILDSDKSAIYKKYGSLTIQDPYSLRCIPQIHGVVYDNLVYTKNILETEINSVTDNPLIFEEDIISGGNFHGQYIGNAADIITISMSLLCNISERRLDKLITGTSVVPKFLVTDSGLNSGFMIIQYSSAGITAEVRTMASPGSIHSIPTCLNVEDVVSMAGYSARKAYTATERTFQVLANEAISAVQALDFTKEKPGRYVLDFYNKVREIVPFITKDSYMQLYIKQVHDFVLV